jgi:hypothetical protein
MHSIEGRSREAMSPGKDGLAHFQAQISKISPDVLFAQYALFAEQAREVPLLQKGFAGLFSVVRRSLDLDMRTSKQGSSECWYCGLLKQFLKDGAGFAEKKWIKDLHLEHTSWHNGETKVYEDVCFLAKDPGSGVISMNTDGAARHAHTLPKVEGRVPKNIPEWTQKLQGVLVHGRAISLFNLIHDIKSGANDADHPFACIANHGLETCWHGAS